MIVFKTRIKRKTNWDEDIYIDQKSMCVCKWQPGPRSSSSFIRRFSVGRINGENCVLPDLIVCTQLQGNYKVIQIYFMLHQRTASLLSPLPINAGCSISLQGRGHKAAYMSILSPIQARTQHNHFIRTDTHSLMMLVLRDSKNIML